MISILFLDDTACEILDQIRCRCQLFLQTRQNILGSESLVVHEEQVNVPGVVNQESLVPRWHHVASLLIGSETNLCGEC